MTTEKAIDILTRHEDDNEALETLAYKAKAFDYIQEKLGISCHDYVGYSLRIHVKNHDCDLIVSGYDKPLLLALREAFREDEE